MNERIKPLLAELERLKTERPEGWMKSIKATVKKLEELSDPFADMVHEHTEEYGRTAMYWPKGPYSDDYSEESDGEVFE